MAAWGTAVGGAAGCQRDLTPGVRELATELPQIRIGQGVRGKVLIGEVDGKQIAVLGGIHRSAVQT